VSDPREITGLAEIAPGEAVPDAEILLAQRDAVAPLLDTLEEKLRQRIAAVDGDLGNFDPGMLHRAYLHVLRFFQRFSPRMPSSDLPR
jgi:hypothetical protein